MVRTRADAGATKVSAAKAPRKVLAPSGGGAGASSSSATTPSKANKYGGGNSYNPQPIPEWQKGINTFFKPGATSLENGGGGSSSSSHDTDAPQSSSMDTDTPQASSAAMDEPHSTSSFTKNGIISDDDDD